MRTGRIQQVGQQKRNRPELVLPPQPDWLLATVRLRRSARVRSRVPTVGRTRGWGPRLRCRSAARAVGSYSRRKARPMLSAAKVDIFERRHNHQGMTCTKVAQEARCSPHSVYHVAYVPAGGTLALDGQIGRAIVECADVGETSPDAYGRDGGPLTFPLVAQAPAPAGIPPRCRARASPTACVPATPAAAWADDPNHSTGRPQPLASGPYLHRHDSQPEVTSRRG